MNLSNSKKKETEIVIIGGGGSGLSAAVAAREKGVEVVVLEKRHHVGGNAAIAGGLLAAESPIQKRLKIDARKDQIFKMAMDYSHWKINPDIFRAFVDKSGDTIRWLEEMGVEFEDVPHFLPNQVPRVFHLPKGHGAGLVKGLVRRGEALGIQCFYETAGKEILLKEEGIEVLASKREEEVKVMAKAVIIATGGYAGNKELLKRYYPDYTEELYSVGLPHMGDGLLMALQIGAATEGLGFLQLRGPYFRGSLEVVTVAMEPQTVWVNRMGERFADETIAFQWPEAANALNRQPEKVSYTLLDERLKKCFMEEGIIKGYSRFSAGSKITGLEKRLQLESERGGVMISNSWDEIGKWIGASPNVLNSTLAEYNHFCDQGYDETFFKDRKFLFPLRHPPYYAIRCVQGFLGTIGGIKINPHMEVLNSQGEPIPGLYAAGNDTGGWETETYCLTLSGTALGFAINSGRIAGENSAKFVLKNRKKGMRS